jgi:hypothetical protein
MEIVELVERLSALESVVEQMGARQESLAVEAQENVGRIVATVESAREVELEHKLAEAEAKIAELSAAGSHGRKTAVAGRMFAKDGEVVETGVLDAALTGLSVEQRISVKSALLRSGMVG